MNYSHYEISESMRRFKLVFHSIPLPKLSKGEFFLLSVLKTNESINVSRLAKYMDVSAPAVSRTLGKLESKKYITRTVDSENRRNICVKLTKEGEMVFDNAYGFLCQFMDSVVKSMGEDNINQLTMLMNMMSDIIEKKL